MRGLWRALLLAPVAAAACSGQGEAACRADTGCVWQPLWDASGCATNPCISANSAPACSAVQQTIATGCTPLQSDADFCLISVCAWDAVNSACAVQTCMHLNESACNADTASSCKWYAGNLLPALSVEPAPSELLPACVKDVCGHVARADCTEARGCHWEAAGATCKEMPCTSKTTESACTLGQMCQWDSSKSPACRSTYCGTITDAAQCAADAACMYLQGTGPCMQKTCDKYNVPTDTCACQEDPNCKWMASSQKCVSTSSTECADLDLVLLLDSSGSMRRQFGPYMHGFIGLMEILRTWVGQMPLSGDDHTAGMNPRGEGFRATFIQFAHAQALPSDNHPTNCVVGVCTDGKLSGLMSELNGDIDWHEQHYQRGWTYIHQALHDAADAFVNTPSTRKRVVMVFADGGLTDYDGDACSPSCGAAYGIDRRWLPEYRTSLYAGQDRLRAEGVIIFGIVLRRFQQHTFEDTNAEQKLKPLVSDPKDTHFMNLMMDEIPTKVLLSLCNPDSTFGRILATPKDPCPNLPEAECNALDACAYAAFGGCQADEVCSTECRESMCIAKPECQWVQSRNICKRLPQTLAPETLVPPTRPPSTDAPATQPPPTLSPITPAPDTLVPPSVAPATAMPSTASPPVLTPAPAMDECSSSSNICSAQNQVCVDGDLLLSGNWECRCKLPSKAKAVAGPALDCSVDECAEHGARCAAAGQRCVDTDKQTPETWECQCISPQTGASVRGTTAHCVNPPGDCDLHGHVCTSAGQLCNSGTNTQDGKFQCECIAPATGVTGNSLPATCRLDECTVSCSTCAILPGGTSDVCSGVGQTCIDNDKDYLSLHDWACLCPPPETGMQIGAVASCELNECKAVCGTCANTGVGNTCELSGQTCVEGLLSATSDWSCVCVHPASGEQVGAPASCSEDECQSFESICVSMGQTCEDRSRSTRGDWVCVCPPPSLSIAVGQAATCKLDECTIPGIRTTCTAALQECFDPVDTSENDWECRCPAPSSGTAIAQVVPKCGLDECAEVCPTCANTNGKGSRCELSGQKCVDPVPTTGHLNDWMCLCPFTNITALTSLVTPCKPGKDECVQESGAVQACKHATRYTTDGCMCACDWQLGSNDCDKPGCTPASGPGSKGVPCDTGCCNPDSDTQSWCFIANNDYNKAKPQCGIQGKNGFGYCAPVGQRPADGGYQRESFIPGVPSTQINVCTDAAQRCVDPDEQQDDDWRCECVLPKSGIPGNHSVATCVQDECISKSKICADVKQVCRDPDTTVLGDWVCECPPSAKPNSTVGAPTACFFDECAEQCPSCAVVMGANVCAGVGQVCVDPTPHDLSLGDWECQCKTGNGSARAGLAWCSVNECTETCPSCAYDGNTDVCAAKGQTCHDPDHSPSSLRDWECRCAAPSLSVGKLGPATCEIDECAGTSVCSTGQMCVDTNLSDLGDFRCECISPAQGAAVADPATCEEDECRVHSQTCRSVGQECVDANLQKLGTWECRCVAPDTGPAQNGGVATCVVLDECKGNTACSAVGQHCADPSGAAGDWQCRCLPPFQGTPATAKPAECRVDECTAVCSTCQKTSAAANGTCALYGQACTDNSLTTLRDWVCTCQAPSVGDAAVMHAATCMLDECSQSCPTCANGVCSAAGQTCHDKNNGSQHLGDWYCQCPLPSMTQATRGPASACDADECYGNEDICKAGGQLCFDPSHSTVGDWKCLCAPPALGGMKGGLSTCETNECTAVCPTCADTGRGNVCTDRGQRCVDSNHTQDGDWVCECIQGIGATVGGAVPVCALNECEEFCPTCASSVLGNICTQAGQVCEDPRQDATSLSDWKCRCKAPLSSLSATGAAADCRVDECHWATNNTIPGQVCLDAGQLCRDPSMETLGDFKCLCPPPSTGSNISGPAVCALDECVLHEHVCKDHNQSCSDPNPTETNDWLCVCNQPLHGSSKRQPAVCEEDECYSKSAICRAATPPQNCVDTNKLAPDTWECHCLAPSSGTASLAAATCILDECTANCSTCAHDTCRGSGQTCADPNPAHSSLNDWVCHCSAPSTGSSVGSVAECPFDECTHHASVCIAKDQKCNDPDMLTYGDWECGCISPQMGRAIAEAATCKLDDCKERGHICTNAGQACFDPSLDPASQEDWECHCLPPALEKAVAKEAVCSLKGECADPRINNVCTSKGQVCDDPDTTVLQDWRCVCTPPSRGMPVTAGPAHCELNECEGACSSCAGTVCAEANQVCVDTNTDPVTGINTWECRCTTPASGAAVGAAADCALNECDLYESTCTGAAQDCFDPNNRLSGDWVCSCRLPATGQATGAPARCTSDECYVHARTCEEAGQMCHDPDTSVDSINDWRCECRAPWVGNATMQAAVCVADDCVVYGSTCTSVGQLCEDLEMTLPGFWYCFCPPPNQKVRRSQGVATCLIDECVVHTNRSAVLSEGAPNVCTQAGQTCYDPNDLLSQQGDWYCSCVEPSTDIAVGMAVPQCTFDECRNSTNAAVCGTDQTCEDPDWTSLDTWTCRCVLPRAGVAVTSRAECGLDECISKNAICKDSQQTCRDTDPSVPGSWACQCPHDSRSQQGGVASCDPPLESECNVLAIRHVCESKGQLCFDPSFNVTDDWQCECVPPQTGTPMAHGHAVCRLDECTAVCPTCALHACTDHNQTCHDPDTNIYSLGDWECRCTLPETGVAHAASASCILDECASTCPTCADTGSGNQCLQAGQHCVDDQQDPRSVGDWRCVCGEPSIGNSTATVAFCDLDECLLHASQCGAEQVCSDPDHSASSQGDWLCTCPLPATGYAVAQAARCVLNECNDDAPYSACFIAGQICDDPNPTLAGRNDWVCRCPEGGLWQLGGRVEQCLVNECNVTCPTCADKGGGNVCTEAGQTCVDPNTSPHSKGDWRCECAEGAFALGNVAVCYIDECTKDGAVCAAAGQDCVDSDRRPTSRGDWSCRCRPPSQGADAPHAVATCGMNECLTMARVCTDAGQTCVDPSHADGDWQCVCSPGVAATGKPAVCPDVGECEATGFVCNAVGQRCLDPNTDTHSDWVCQCIPPAVGESQRGGPTSCILNECTAACPTCADSGYGNVCDLHGQRCFEGSTSPQDTRDWKCACPTGSTGERVGAPAKCEQDECRVNNGRLSALCGAAGQTCIDPDPSALVLNDWRCVCPPPSVGEATAMVAPCQLDECLTDTKASVCTSVGQVCIDRNTDARSLGDWYCQCADPAGPQRSAARAPADCTPNRYSWCQENEAICTSVGQACLSGQRPQEGKCRCMAPQQGPDGVGVAATCELDECSTICSTCADTGSGNVCTKQGQECMEGSKNPVTGRHDWRCKCSNSSITALVAPASCSVNECEGAGRVCADHGQSCSDPDTRPDHLDDWVCTCPSPQEGKRTAGTARCYLDECRLYRHDCTAHGQRCLDTNTSAESRGNWECRCVPPAVGSAVGHVAECTNLGECALELNSAICTSAGQVCNDPDSSNPNDWQCLCVWPETGTIGQQGAARCILDECQVECATCAQKTGSQAHACETANQACSDPNTDIHSMSDWFCTCREPDVGVQVGAAASCLLDECNIPTNKRVCDGPVSQVAGTQVCRDPDQATMGDWRCECIPPLTGPSGVGEPAACRLDECSVPGPTGKSGNDVCLPAGQTCLDPQQGVAALGNWLCRCADRTTDVAMATPVASCTAPDLCQVHAGECPPQQYCVVKEDDWFCRCLSPTEGEARHGPAECILDECRTRCETCAQQGASNPCVEKEQQCVDFNTSLASLRDWVCVCEVGAGQALGEAASCVVDECATNGAVCRASDQECLDPDKRAESRGDWMCQCFAPASGHQVAGFATCKLNECGLHGGTCTAVGQTCVDENEAVTSLGDWQCQCPHPALGHAYRMAATCIYMGGCIDDANKQICTDAGQQCVPGLNRTNGDDFRCACLSPLRGDPMARGPASCVIDECQDICPTCARTRADGLHVCITAGQHCQDPNLSAGSLGDWLCVCPPPSLSAELGKPVASCYLDECKTPGQQFAVQCHHFRRFSLSGCECECGWRVSSELGLAGGPGFSSPCDTACCNPDESSAGEWCPVADTEFNRNNAECKKLISKHETCAFSGAAAPASFVMPQVTDVCMEAGQKCVDNTPSETSTGDWECKCVDSAGSARLQPALCVLDECRRVTLCAAAGQLCHDPDHSPASRGDWTCNCTSGMGGRAGAIAQCEYLPDDECAGTIATCGEGQYCKDPDVTFTGDWECHCISPAEGSVGYAEPATCALNECLAQCLTCADTGDGNGNVCRRHGQICLDPSIHLSDWLCECAAPGSGSTVTAVAACVFDECSVDATSAICSRHGQKCVDHDHSYESLNDWVCRCSPPQEGADVGRAAICLQDECADPAVFSVCTTQGQRCVDTKQAADSLGDWQCVCQAPATGSADAKPAACIYTGECVKEEHQRVCNAARQTCVDATPDTDGDWLCACLAPESGTNGKKGPGKCGIDECTTHCPTCANGFCAAVGQGCIDPDTAVLGNWLCKCTAPLEGYPRPQIPAVCSGVPCQALNASTCDEVPLCTYIAEVRACVTNGTYSSPVLPSSTTESLTATLSSDSAVHFSAPEDDDSGCAECWLLLLLLPCLSILAALVWLYMRRKAQKQDDEDQKWNKQFEADPAASKAPELFENTPTSTPPAKKKRNGSHDLQQSLLSSEYPLAGSQSQHSASQSQEMRTRKERLHDNIEV